jgi:putative membrane protein
VRDAYRNDPIATAVTRERRGSPTIWRANARRDHYDRYGNRVAFVIRILATAIAVWVATVLPGINLTGDSVLANVFTVIAVAVIFGLINAFIKPVIKVVGCVFYVLTLGLIALVVNALLFMLTGWIAEQIDLPFEVDGFWQAFWGAIIVGVVSWAITMAVPDRGRSGDE